MENNNIIINVVVQAGKVYLKIVWDFIYFPFWWYSVGLIRTLRATGRFLRNQEMTIGFWVWLRNIFVPMYGQHDLAGRAISLVVRLIQVIFRGLALLLCLILALAFLGIYLLLPPFLIWALWYQLF
jgi:hypothetical protein